MDLISIFPALWTAGADTATGTTDLVPSVQDVVDTMGEEVKQTSSILSKIFQPILDKLPSLIFAVLFLLIGMFLIKQIMRILKRAFNRSNMDGIMSSFIRSVAKIILYVLLIVIALSILDVPMDSIVAVIASAGVAIGLALKDSLSNLAGGFIILFSKPLKEGDTIEADGVMGKVEAITILYTRIVTVDNKTVFIPNGVVASGKIINYTDKETRRVDLNFGISYEDDIDAARAAGRGKGSSGVAGCACTQGCGTQPRRKRCNAPAPGLDEERGLLAAALSPAGKRQKGVRCQGHFHSVSADGCAFTGKHFQLRQIIHAFGDAFAWKKAAKYLHAQNVASDCICYIEYL